MILPQQFFIMGNIGVIIQGTLHIWPIHVALLIDNMHIYLYKNMHHAYRHGCMHMTQLQKQAHTIIVMGNYLIDNSFYGKKWLIDTDGNCELNCQ